jgi:CheY-like chemotaxis protein
LVPQTADSKCRLRHTQMKPVCQTILKRKRHRKEKRTTNVSASKTTTKAAELEPCDNGRALVVDDEPSLRMIHQKILQVKFPQYKTETASNGAEAVKAVRASHPALILMDIRMPVMDGTTTFLKIHELCEENNWEMPHVVFCTAFDPSPEVKSIIAADKRHGFMRKPTSMSALVKTIEDRFIQ